VAVQNMGPEKYSGEKRKQLADGKVHQSNSAFGRTVGIQSYFREKLIETGGNKGMKKSAGRGERTWCSRGVIQKTSLFDQRKKNSSHHIAEPPKRGEARVGEGGMGLNNETE